MQITRWSVAMLAVSLSIVSGGAGLAAPHHTPPESALLACHEDILAASRTWTSDLEGHLGRCLTHGLDCLTSSRDPAACCARIVARCDDDRAKILDGASDFETQVGARSCTRVRFGDVLAPEGLGFGTLAARCACLTPPVATDTLSGFATCLRRLIEDDVVQRMVLVDAPRGREALACLGIDADFPAVLQDRPALCETCAASPTPTSTLTPRSTSTPGQTSLATVTTPTATRTLIPATFTATPLASTTPVATTTPIATTTPLASSTPLTFPSATATIVAQPTATVPTPTVTPTPIAVCGNGILEGDEECDGAVIDNTGCLEDICTCDDFCDDAGGTLSCNPNCTVNFSACTAGGCSF